MVGSEVIRQAILDNGIESVTAITRKPLSISHSKLKTIIHSDFLKYDSIVEELKINDAVIWCLGISQSQVSTAQYEQITYDFTVAAAKAMYDANPKSTFLFLSGAGADPSEKSLTLFARIKGKTENALLKMTLLKLFIARPAGIKPIHKNPNTSIFNKLVTPLLPVLEALAPAFVISSDILAKALINIVKDGSSNQIIHNAELKVMGLK